jgi:alkylation response protein AidB-like acyl-CoA dehydrogenase
LIKGLVRCVRHGELAHQYLVTVMAADGLCILRVPRDAAGLTVEGYRLIDAAGAADLHFNQVRVDGGACLRVAGGPDAILCEALDWGIFALVAETVGIVTTLNKATFRYLMSRKQFGSLIGSFQALQHRAADMHIAAEEVAAVAELAIEAMQIGARGNRAAIVSAAKVVADGAGRRIGHESVQMHGGMGVSDELNISHYARRLAAIRAQLGFADIHRLRFGAAQ